MTVNEQLLAEHFAQALDALRADPKQSPSTWTATWSEGLPSGPFDSLLQTLHTLEEASKDWRAAGGSEPATLDGKATGDFVPREPQPTFSSIGRYQIVRRLGAGGMGVVWLAHDPQLHRHVAIKMPHLSRDDGVALQRFLREARSAANVKHPNICPIHDVGEVEGRPFVVMEYVEGDSLETRIRAVGRIENVVEAVTLAREILAALAAVHGRGMVHRDLKPANVMMNGEGKAILTDFGLARGVEQHENLSSEGAIVGTPAYMAPEQAAGDATRIGPWTDLYALGVVLYQMLTGRPPFQGQMLTIMHKIANEKPDSPTLFRTDLPAGLERIILRLLAKSPAARYSDAASLDTDLAAVLERKEVSQPESRRRWLVVGLLAACAATVLMGIGILSRPTPQTQTNEGEVTIPTAPLPKADDPVKQPIAPVLAHLTADLELTVWNDNPGERKQGLLGRPGSVPVRPGESLRIRGEVSETAFVYLLWIDGQGRVNPLHPWNPGLGFQPLPAPPMPAPGLQLVGALGALNLGPAYRDEQPTRELQSPASLRDGWEIEGPDGYQMLLFLARRTPLPVDVDLRELIGRVDHPQAAQAAHFDWYCIENDRLAQVDPLRTRSRGPKARQLSDPLLRVMTNLHPHFEAIHGVRFACAAQ